MILYLNFKLNKNVYYKYWVKELVNIFYLLSAMNIMILAAKASK